MQGINDRDERETRSDCSPPCTLFLTRRREGGREEEERGESSDIERRTAERDVG